jgi:uncharacterized membrane protein
MQEYRIERLSDLVFGLALSIGSLAMINQPVTSTSDIQGGILGFVFSFLIIVSVWVSYSDIISENEVETKTDFQLNLALLMLVAIEPYLLYLLGQDEPSILNFSSTAFAIDIGLIMLILAGMNHRVRPAGTSDVTRHRLDGNRHLVIGSIFLLSALPFLWQPDFAFNINLRFVIWILALVPGVLFRVQRLSSFAGNR